MICLDRVSAQRASYSSVPLAIWHTDETRCIMWNLSNWAAIAQVVQSIVVLFALIYAVVQLNEAGKARKLQATRELINEIGDKEVREDRWFVLYEMFDAAELSDDDHKRASRVAVAYDRVGYMVRQRLIPEDALFDWQQDEIELLWPKLEPVVTANRKTRPHYCTHFEYLFREWLPRMKNTHEEE